MQVVLADRARKEVLHVVKGERNIQPSLITGVLIRAGSCRNRNSTTSSTYRLSTFVYSSYS